ncbi:MAG: DUF4112 domain-containing protein [Verrucomicrobia bacterium]|nr:DUF4112 domain-containing protein [Verrucomicrobiota bacterium]
MIENEPAVRATRLVYPDPPGLRRIRSLSRFLDQSIILPGGYRIGFDPIIGLIPAAGELITAALSCYMILEAYRLGIPKRVIAQMAMNVAAETIVGTVPVVGDVFDAVWKANMRNLRLVELAYHPNLKSRPAWRLVLGLAVGFFVVWIASLALLVSIFRYLLSWF